MYYRRLKYIYGGITLMFDIGVILLVCLTGRYGPVARILLPLLPPLALAVCLIPWPHTRPRTQAWVGALLIGMVMGVVSGLLAAL